MKCFFISKGKSKTKEISKSAPELNRGRKSDKSNQENGLKSSYSLPSPRSIGEMYKEKEQNLRVFSFQELSDATNGFNRMLKIGEGGFGCVYKGRVKPLNDEDDPIIVAIKKLNQHSLQGHKEWLAEVQFLGVVSHPNLVKLLGYATENDRGIQRLLVYELLPNRSLEYHLFNRTSPTLPWKQRLEIILGAAQGLAYLHGGLEVQVIYRDFKSSNVLLDEHFKPKLSDFGLAREGPVGDRTHVSTAVVGTQGYAAPEYLETGRLTSHCDVWSFGVVLYEILTGRRVLDRSRPMQEQKLLYWVRQFPVDSSMFTMLIDPRLRNQYSLSSAREVARLADRCLNKNAKSRPAMTEVVECLTKALTMSEEKNTSQTQTQTQTQNHGFRLSASKFADQKNVMVGRKGKV